MGSSFVVRKEPLPVWIGYLLVFFIVTNHITDETKRIRLIKALALISIPISILTITQSFGFGLFYPDIPAQLQVSATLGNPIYAGAYLALLIPVVIALVISATSLRSKILWVFPGILATTALVLTYNRGAWFGFFVGILVFLALVLTTRSPGKRRWWIVALIAFLALILSGFMVIQKVAPRTLSIFESATSGIEFSGTALKRVLILQSTLPMIIERPLFGWGPETYRDIFLKYQEPSLVELATERPLTADRPHNQLLYIAYSFGLIGLTSYCWIILTFLGKVKRWVVRSSWREKIFFIGITSSIMGYVVQEQFSFSTAAVTPLFWLFLGVGTGINSVRPVPVSFRVPKPVRIIAIFFLTLIAGGLVFLFFRVIAADYFYHSGRMLASQGKFEGSLARYTRAITLNPFESSSRFSFGVDSRALSLQTGDVTWVEDAIPIVSKGLQQNSLSYDLYFMLGDLYYLSSFLQGNTDYSDAREAYVKTIEIAPNYSQAYLGIGLSLLEEGKNQEAIPYLEQAVSVTSSLWQAWDGLGRAYEKMGRIPEAVRYYEKVLEINPNYGPAREKLKNLRAKD